MNGTKRFHDLTVWPLHISQSLQNQTKTKNFSVNSKCKYVIIIITITIMS